MSNIKKSNKSKLFKGAVVGAAGLMCLGFAPVTAFQAWADYLGDNNTIGSEAIIISSVEGEDSSSVNKGNKYYIPNAYFGTKSKIQLGKDNYDTVVAQNYGEGEDKITAITSTVNVYYSTGQKIATAVEDAAGAKQGLSYFTAHYVGDYTVKYEINVTYGTGTEAETKTYSTELAVESESTSAHMAFEDDVVLPAIYDKSMASKKNIVLPMPTVYEDANSKEEIEIDEVLLNAGTAQDNENTLIVTITPASGGKAITINYDATKGGYYIDGNDIASKASSGDNFVVKYSYYVGANDFVASVSKTFTVYDNYYEEDGKEYNLTATHEAMTAITQVATKLGTVKAYTNEDLKEEVAVTVDAKAYRKDKNGDYKETKEGSIKDGYFTPWADGDYKIVFTVTDFYGNTATTEEYIFEVKDTQKPVAVMYDANNAENDRAKQEFVSAETILKTKTNQRNVIIYAIGATDNIKGEANIASYKRTLKSSSRTIEITGYNAYNLIFDCEDSDLVKLLAQNEALREVVEADLGVQPAVEGDELNEYLADLATWLKNHKYLRVTSTPVDGCDSEADYIAKGLAYVDVAYGQTLLSGSNAGTAYTLSYVATDKAGNVSATESYTISITTDDTFVDDTNPTVTLNSTFREYYSKEDVIKFSAPTISDDIDNYLNKSISYQYYKETSKTTKLGEAFTFENDKYEINIAKDIKTLVAAGVTDAPAMIVLTVYAEDDFGNETTKNFEMKILEINDTKAPTLKRENYVTAPNAALQNQTVTLPTIVYTDDNAGFISSDVEVFHIVKDGDGKETRIPVESYGKKYVAETKLPVQTYTLNAGSFVASYSGQYEAVVRIKDYNGNYIVTYYYYEVSAVVDKESFTVSTTLDKSSTIETGEELELPAPTVSGTLTEKDGYTVYGVKGDDSNVATDYRVVVKNANNPDEYELPNYEYFKGLNYRSYQYALAYEVNLHIFKSTLGFATSEGNGVTLEVGPSASQKTYYMNKLTKVADHDGDYLLVNYDANGIANLIYGAVQANGIDVVFYNLENILDIDDNGAYVLGTDGTTKYYASLQNDRLTFVANGANANDYFTIEVDTTNINFVANGTGAIASKLLTSLSTEAISMTTNDYIVTTRTSDLHYVTVGDNTAPTLRANYTFKDVEEKGATVSLQPINAEDKSTYFASGIDTEKSYVQIAFSGRTPTGAETSSTYDFNMDEWKGYDEYNEETGNIDYKLSATNNGRYTITYHIVDKAGNEASITEGYTQFTIKVGDVTSPALKVKEDLIADAYKVGDTLTLDFDKITMSDAITTDVNKLMETLKVTVTNTTSGKEVENLGEGKVKNDKTGEYSCDYKYKLGEVGSYKIVIEVKDEAYNVSTKTIEFEVEEATAEPNVVSTVVGIVLTVVAVLVLGGVITYFVVSKVKLDKELKGKGKKK